MFLALLSLTNTSQTPAAPSASGREVFDSRFKGGGQQRTHWLWSQRVLFFPDRKGKVVEGFFPPGGVFVSSAAELCWACGRGEQPSPALGGGYLSQRSFLALCHRGSIWPVWWSCLRSSELLLLPSCLLFHGAGCLRLQCAPGWAAGKFYLLCKEALNGFCGEEERWFSAGLLQHYSKC